VYEAFQGKDMRKARSLQKLILKSKLARLSAIAKRSLIPLKFHLALQLIAIIQRYTTSIKFGYESRQYEF
jgi:hypothetical protein